jgi:hypothetical protein
VRRFLLLAALVAVLGACGGGSAPVAATPIVFGATGGSIAPYRVTIQPDGMVRMNPQGTLDRQIPPARVRQLTSEIRQAHLSNRSCAGVLPDVASLYIRASGRTVTVHGGCDAQFLRVWADLSEAVGRPVS